MAIEICSKELAWGDEQMGMCQAPGGDYYLFWVDTGEVFVVDINTMDENQDGFQNAVIARKAAYDSMWRSAKALTWEIPVFGVSLAFIPAACGTGFACAADVAVAAGSGGLISKAGSNIGDDFYYCGHC